MSNLNDISSSDWIVGGQFLPGPQSITNPTPIANISGGYGITDPTQLPSLTGTGVGNNYSIGNSLFDVGQLGNYDTTPTNAPAQTTQQSCGLFDFQCSWNKVSQGFTVPTMQSVIGGTIAGMTGTTPGSSTGWLESYFTRATIVILGFVFVAAGLMMFKGKAIVNVATKAMVP